MSGWNDSIKTVFVMIQQLHSYDIPPKMKNVIQTKTYTQMFREALSIIAKSGNNSNVHELMNR